ncbi:pilus assembly protein CpaF [Paraperlucidibaca baekdonensis]|uniref:Pilus assembly protein CpaF n=1 Tax=Paraperlucidibaca baekdonensis TaxID=748120 RepID=A0A3E0H6A0_9GAMM|nr:CpaF family protein [Paraperlucidibaca baekdonensis]REH39031.1 pilus assembly protein CpaF [Paraperlucidibaca baekdonensis]
MAGYIPGGRLSPKKVDEDIANIKFRFHRFLIARVDDDSFNILESTRQAIFDYVQVKLSAYVNENSLPLSRYEADRLAEELVDELVGFGPLESLLRDSSVTEIMVNGAERIFYERDGVIKRSQLSFVDDNHVARVIQRILAPIGRRLDESSPMVDARMPDGSRVNAIIPPIALDGPSISIRKFRHDLLQANDLVTYRSVSDEMLQFIKKAVSYRANILVSGGTGTGKTTFLNVLSGFINHHERIVTIEDTAELQLNNDHVVRLETRPPNAEGFGEVSARDLIRNALRMRPDRIIVGEVRSYEVMDMLQAMNTGHEGSMSTLHANSAADALLRMETLVGLSGQKISEATLRAIIVSAVDIVVQLTRLPNGRRCVAEITEVVDLRDDQYVTNPLFKLDRVTGEHHRASSAPSKPRVIELMRQAEAAR